jgi:hypothetical protein
LSSIRRYQAAGIFNSARPATVTLFTCS